MENSNQYWTDSGESLLWATAQQLGMALHPTNRDGLAQLRTMIEQDTLFPNRHHEVEEIIRREGSWTFEGSFAEGYPYTEPLTRSLFVQEALPLIRDFPQRCSVCCRHRPTIEQRGDRRFCAACWPFVEREYRKGERKSLGIDAKVRARES